MASILLAAFVLRALIPPGFMPAGDRAFAFELCWEGLPAGFFASAGPAGADAMDMGSTQADSRAASRHGAHTHPGSPWHNEHCVFGSACSAGPTPHLPLPGDVSGALQLRAVAFASIAGAVRLVHLPQSRAPPAHLS